jgi:hypothetical protein
MAPQNIVTFDEPKHPFGVNEDTAESSIPQGFVENITNGYPSGDLLVKRKGYQLKAGAIPLRVTSIKAVDASDTLYLSCSGNLDLTSVSNRPIIVYGTTSSSYCSAFSTTTPTALFVPTPSLDPRKVVSKGTTATLALTGEETSLTTSDVLVGVAESLSFTNGSNSLVLPNVNVKQTPSYDITATVVNGTDPVTGSDAFYFMYYIVADDEDYPSYIYTQVLAADTWTFSPGLPSNNLIIRYYNTDGDELVPDTQEIDYTTGEVTAEFSYAVAGKAVMITVPAVNALQGEQILPYTSGSSPVETVISLPAGTATKLWGFIEIFELDIANTLYKKILPDTQVVNADGSVDLTFNSYSPDLLNTRIIWTFTDVQARVALELPGGSVTSDVTDTDMQMCIYGLSSSAIFEGAEGTTGWVTSVDTYATENVQELFATCGWNSFTASDDPALLLPSHQIFLRCSTYAGGTDTIIGPCFYPSAQAQSRTRGGIISSSVSVDNKILAESATFVSGNRVTFRASLTGLTTFGSPIITAEQDYVTISQAPYSQYIGSWKIEDHTIGADYIEISVDIPSIDDNSFNLTG